MQKHEAKGEQGVRLAALGTARAFGGAGGHPAR
jgi:hypothetical protein